MSSIFVPAWDMNYLLYTQHKKFNITWVWYWISEAFVALDLFFIIIFFSSGVIKCWGDLKRSLHWGGKTAITALMQWSRRPSSPSFGPVTVYIKSEIMCCVGAKVMRPLGSNQGWHSPTYSYSNSTASTFTQCHTRVAGEQREQKQQCEEKWDRHRAEELCKHVGAAALQWKIRLKKKQCIDKAARFTRWCNTAAADADLLDPDHTNV